MQTKLRQLAPLYRISRCCVETELMGPGGNRDQAEATAPVQAREGVVMDPSGGGDSSLKGRNLPMQTGTFKSSYGFCRMYTCHSISWFPNCLLFSGPNKLGGFFPPLHRVVLAGVFVSQPNMCCCSQKWRFLTPQWQTTLSTENKFYICFQKLV